MAHKVFINYRRGDSKAPAGRIRDHLVEAFGEENVFMDPPGVPYVEYLKSQIPSYDIFLVLIGPNWVKAADARGHHLGDPDDPITLEIVAALDGKSRVIPITFDDARMPTEEELPPPLKRLAGLHAVDVRDTHFRSDVAALIKRVDGRPLRRWVNVAGAVAALVLVWLVYAFWPPREQQTTSYQFGPTLKLVESPKSAASSPAPTAPPPVTPAPPAKTPELLPIPSPPPAPEPTFAITPNRDIYGQDILQAGGTIGISGLDQQDCANKCAGDATCVAYSYDRWLRKCYPKKGLAAANLDPSSVSGIKRSLHATLSLSPLAPKLSRRSNSRFPGPAMATSRTSDINGCQAACEAVGEQRCVAFTFLKNVGSGANCRLFDNPEKRFVADDSADSGWREPP